jgi:hypothetical protein
VGVAGIIKAEHNFKRKVQLNATGRKVQIHIVQVGSVVMAKMGN